MGYDKDDDHFRFNSKKKVIGENRSEKVKYINKVSLEMRPTCTVVYIKKSHHREGEIMVTIGANR